MGNHPPEIAREVQKILVPQPEIQKATMALVVCCLCAFVRVHIVFIIRRSYNRNCRHK